MVKKTRAQKRRVQRRGKTQRRRQRGGDEETTYPYLKLKSMIGKKYDEKTISEYKKEGANLLEPDELAEIRFIADEIEENLDKKRDTIMSGYITDVNMDYFEKMFPTYNRIISAFFEAYAPYFHKDPSKLSFIDKLLRLHYIYINEPKYGKTNYVPHLLDLEEIQNTIKGEFITTGANGKLYYMPGIKKSPILNKVAATLARTKRISYGTLRDGILNEIISLISNEESNNDSNNESTDKLTAYNYIKEVEIDKLDPLSNARRNANAGATASAGPAGGAGAASPLISVGVGFYNKTHENPITIKQLLNRINSANTNMSHELLDNIIYYNGTSAVTLRNIIDKAPNNDKSSINRIKTLISRMKTSHMNVENKNLLPPHLTP